MELPTQAQDEVAARLTATAAERRQTRAHIADGTLLEADTPARIEKRKTIMLAQRGPAAGLPPAVREALAAGPVREASAIVRRAFERQIGGNDTQPCWFLTRGAALRRTVGRVHVRMGTARDWGTGFLVAPNLLLTNQHVLDSAATARSCRVEFDFEETFEGEFLPSALFDLAPDTLFVSDPAQGGLDYALVAVASQPRRDSQRQDVQLAEFGWNTLVREEGKVALGEAINIIHHPEAQPRQASLRENRVVALQDPALAASWLHYETDTESGSSGAPLFSNDWLVVGVHHKGVEKRDRDGNILAIGGALWTPEMGERQKWWYANEGLRISRFVAHVRERVAAAVAAAAPPAPDCVITEAGLALFEALTRPIAPGAAAPSVAPAATTDARPRKVPRPE